MQRKMKTMKMLRLVALAGLLVACAAPLEKRPPGTVINPPYGAVLFCQDNPDHPRCDPEAVEK